MMEEWALFALATAASSSVILYWTVQTFRHNRRISRVPIRIHVNGIRGKSTIVRYIAASLRAGGIETIAKRRMNHVSTIARSTAGAVSEID